MAKRLCFISTSEEKMNYKEDEIEFEYFNGFALPQKQNSIKSMHEAINKKYPYINILEISTKSSNSLGIQLSAFNLKYYNELDSKHYNIENVFQSSKVFENGGPYRDLLNVHPRDAKRDARLKESGNLLGFNYNNEDWGLVPKTAFYDWIYINALSQNEQLTKLIMAYDIFTDIEFNHTKSFNCQARSAAIYVSLRKKGNLDDILKDKEAFLDSYIEKKRAMNIHF